MQDWAEGELGLQCCSSNGLSQSPWELWSWDNSSEISLTQVSSQTFVALYGPVPGCGLPTSPPLPGVGGVTLPWAAPFRGGLYEASTGSIPRHRENQCLGAKGRDLHLLQGVVHIMV